MTHARRLDLLWVVLVGLTVAGALLADRAEPGPLVTLFIVLTMAFKGRMVVDHFMAMKGANRTLRALMRGYFWILPAVTALVVIFGDWIARVTAIQ